MYHVDNESHKDRILVFSFEGGQLQLVSEIRSKGAIYNLNAFNGKLAARINKKIEMY